MCMIVGKMRAPKMSLALQNSKQQHGGDMIFHQVEIVSGVRQAVQRMGGTKCYAQTDGRTRALLCRLLQYNKK